jgi:hypothetical protein
MAWFMPRCGLLAEIMSPMLTYCVHAVSSSCLFMSAIPGSVQWLGLLTPTPPVHTQILKLLKESQGNILDDEQLINTLNHSKLTSSVIAVSL